jgi:hypothetical protein
MRQSLIAAFLVAAFSVPALAQQTAGVNLTINQFIPIGDEFELCLEGPPNSSVLLLVSNGPGSVQTKAGTLCLQLPFWLMIPLAIPDTGSICLPACTYCDQVPHGMSFMLQFVTMGPAPGQVGLSNCTSVTFVDGGYCNPGEHITFTQGAYGGTCNGNNPACVLQQQFPGVFPNGLLMGDADGIDGDGIFALLLTSADAVKAFLPQGGARDPFDQDATDPIDSAAGVLAGQLATAKINVAFDDAGALDPFKAVPGGPRLGDMIFVEDVHPKLLYRTVREVIHFADLAVSLEGTLPLDVDGDNLGDVGCEDLNVALTAVNENYDNGAGDHGHLADPVGW